MVNLFCNAQKMHNAQGTLTEVLLTEHLKTHF